LIIIDSQYKLKWLFNKNREVNQIIIQIKSKDTNFIDLLLENKPYSRLYCTLIKVNQMINTIVAIMMQKLGT